MTLGGFLMELLNLILYCATVVFVAFVILWVLKMFEFPPDENVMKWGKIIVMLLILIAIVGFALNLVGLGGGVYFYPHVFRS